MSLDHVIKERDFYRRKLSEIELLCMEAKHKILEIHVTLIEKVQAVLCQTKMATGSNVQNHSLTNSDAVSREVPISVYLPSTSANILHEIGNSMDSLKPHYDEQAVSSTSPMRTLPKFQSTLDVGENSEEDGKSENAISNGARNYKDKSSVLPSGNKSKSKDEEGDQTQLIEDSNRFAVLSEEFDGSGANVLKARNFDDEIIEENVKRKDTDSANRQAYERVEISYWRHPILIDLPPPLVEHGSRSKEKEIEFLKQSCNLDDSYIQEIITDSSSEVNLETTSASEPKIIPSDEDVVGNGKDGDQSKNVSSNDKRNCGNGNLSNYNLVVKIEEESQALTAEESAEITSSSADFGESKVIVLKTQNFSDHKRTDAKRKSKAVELVNEQTGSGIKRMRQDHSHMTASKSALLKLPFFKNSKDNGFIEQPTQRTPLLKVNSVGAMKDNSQKTAPRPALLEVPFVQNVKDNLPVEHATQRAPLLPDNSIGAVTDNSHITAPRPVLLELPFGQNVKDNLSVEHPKQRTPLLPDNSIGAMKDNCHKTGPRPALLELPFVRNVKDNLPVEHSTQRTPLLPDNSIGATMDNSHMATTKSALLELPFLQNLKDNGSIEQPTQRTPLLQDNSISAMMDNSHVTAPKSALLKLPFLQNLKDSGSVEQPTQRTLLQTPSNPIISQKSTQNFYPSKKKGVPVAASSHYNLGPCLKYKILCNHYSAGSCRQGSKCGFLHPGVNGPPL